MEQLNITNNLRHCAQIYVPSVASDSVFPTTPPPQKSSQGLNKKKRCRIPQQWTVSGDTASTDIGGGNIAVVDLVDLALVQGRKWFPLRRGRNVYASHGSGILMHRLVSGAESGGSIDHRDNNGLNNRRSNLRAATQAQNRANARKFVGASKYKGVRLLNGKWVAEIRHNGKRNYLGYFANEEEAARAYDARAIEFFGEFALVNFPERSAA